MNALLTSVKFIYFRVNSAKLTCTAYRFYIVFAYYVFRYFIYLTLV